MPSYLLLSRLLSNLASQKPLKKWYVSEKHPIIQRLLFFFFTHLQLIVYTCPHPCPFPAVLPYFLPNAHLVHLHPYQPHFGLAYSPA